MSEQFIVDLPVLLECGGEGFVLDLRDFPVYDSVLTLEMPLRTEYYSA